MLLLVTLTICPDSGTNSLEQVTTVPGQKCTVLKYLPYDIWGIFDELCHEMTDRVQQSSRLTSFLS